jgi:hypothetical protein
MPTPSRETTRPASSSAAALDDGDTLRFRAPTLEEAIALAESSLGARVRVVAANRIRRGGIGGFFAADLGVEVTVALDDETMEQALERLVAASDTSPISDASDPLDLRDVPDARPSLGASQTGWTTSVADVDADEVDTQRAEFERRLAAQLGAAAEADAPAAPAAHTVPASDPVALLIGRRFDRRDDEPSPAVNPVLAEVVAALVAEAAEKQALVDAAADESYDPDAHEPALVAEPQSLATWAVHGSPATTDTAPIPTQPTRFVGPDTSPTLAPASRVVETPPTMVRVEQIMAELSAITAEPVFGRDRARPRVARLGRSAATTPVAPDELAERDDHVAHVAHVEAIDHVEPIETPAVVERPRVLPTLPPRPSEVARRAAEQARAKQSKLFATPTAVATAVAPAAPAPTAPAAIDPQPALDEVHVEAEVHADRATSGSADTAPSSAPPSRRQVELAVAATDQLIESLKREEGVKRLSVRVVLRTGDHREVEAEAEWEAS